MDDKGTPLYAMNNPEVPIEIAPAGEDCAHKVILYNVDIINYTVQTARWVYDLPGGFCRFLRPGKFSSLFSLRKAVSRAKPAPLNALLAERESTPPSPNERVRRWKPTPATMANVACLMPFVRPC